MSIKQGTQAEHLARDYLITQGLQWVESNYRCVMGEIDLIMRDGAWLVFVEVRARSSLLFGGAMASVTRSKQQKLLKTAARYLQAKSLYDKQATRFDVLCMDGPKAQMTWIKNAFGVDG